ncbi:hypothetical protein CC1G_06345 [Coprinopsis cinerea okayama7|uniref:Uncharacterized protein n=1 Tax=Coprinopsis cinerea (strain Okayama-7 / 130 / ATCC MYA-4618 / FGSC 9003) TaxID=240176 RepID=A8NTL4_COPC7|nr:hypothetical protein CC1G_06345 [Coprinopsis cinerea okayama7\|eukprot:XP_001836260.2 hypothetical protein CC1G_06345 [Coprinopsis cinerea okayama7\
METDLKKLAHTSPKWNLQHHSVQCNMDCRETSLWLSALVINVVSINVVSLFFHMSSEQRENSEEKRASKKRIFSGPHNLSLNISMRFSLDVGRTFGVNDIIEIDGLMSGDVRPPFADIREEVFDDHSAKLRETSKKSGGNFFQISLVFRINLCPGRWGTESMRLPEYDFAIALSVPTSRTSERF